MRGPEKRMTSRIFSRISGLSQCTRQLEQKVLVSMKGQRSLRLRAYLASSAHSGQSPPPRVPWRLRQ